MQEGKTRWPGRASFSPESWSGAPGRWRLAEVNLSAVAGSAGKPGASDASSNAVTLSGDDVRDGSCVALELRAWHFFDITPFDSARMNTMANPETAEHARLAEATGRAEDDLFNANPWYEWGPYLSERAWGTVREDYSESGDAWDSFPHDHARSRAYRWNEDGMAGISDIRHELCLALALWNGNDPILKERMFGLTGPQGNHGEDVKEYWWYLDALPSHAWNRWRYHYPQQAFPYQDLIDTNAHRNRYQPEDELLDTGAFDGDRYWITEVHYAKAAPDDLLMAIQVTNAGPEDDSIHVLPTAWFRNTWAWDAGEPKPSLSAAGEASVAIEHPIVGAMELTGAAGPGGSAPELLFC